jgi:hypothetical protein
LENPPLWVWAIIVGAIIAGKFIIDGNQQNILLKKLKKKAEKAYLTTKQSTLEIMILKILRIVIIMEM